MKNLKLFTCILSVILFSCSEEKNENFDSNNTIEKLIEIQDSELPDLSSFGLSGTNTSFAKSSGKDAVLDTENNRLMIPVSELNSKSSSNVEFLINKNATLDDGNPCVVWELARLNPRNNPDKCQGGCECGIGFRCSKPVAGECDENGNTQETISSIVGKSSEGVEENLSRSRSQPSKVSYDSNSGVLTIQFINKIDWSYLDN